MAESSSSKASSTSKKIAIIGAGCSGLTAIKSCLDEGLIPKCFERSDQIGGLWNYSDTAVPGTASIYKSLVINTSKDMMMFSDFPAPDNFPPFLTHTKVMEYFLLYARHFKLLEHIQFNTSVTNITKAHNYEITGEWCVQFSRRTKNYIGTGNGTVAHWEEIFQGVMICSGHHSTPYVPDIDGLHTFAGEVIHSHAYKTHETFADKTVVIIGLGNSAADIACDLAKTAKCVHLSSRRGAWIVPRTAFWGLPADMLANSRLVFTMPYSVLDWCVQKQANFRLDHQTYGLKPTHGVLNCHPSINDELPIHLVNGRVQIKPNVKSVEKDGVSLDDGTHVKCDVIIMATGYDYCMDFVSPDVLKIKDNSTDLYEYVFPPHLPHPTLAIIGLVQAIGAAMPISEIQSRWFARLNTGMCKLPQPDFMMSSIHAKRTEMDALYIKSRRHTVQTFWIEYMDRIASHIQVKPNLFKMMFKDPELAIKCFMGPCFPAQYRLTGPGAWPGARQFITTAMSRAFRPRHARNSQQSDKTHEATDLLKTCKYHQNTPTSSKKQCKGVDLFSPNPQGAVQDFTEDSSNLSNAFDQRIKEQLQFDDKCATRRRWHPEWMTLTFYLVLVSFCFLAWMLAILFDKAEIVLSFFEQTVGRYLPVTD